MTSTYATSKSVHGALKRALSPWFLAKGWKRRSGHSCAFLKQAPAGYWCLWIQVSSWGSQLLGSSFALNLVPLEAADTPLCGGPDARVLCTLSESDKRLAFSIAEDIATRIPDPPPSDPVHEWAQLPGHQGEQWRETLANLRKVNPDAWKPGADIWLPYYSVIDLDSWVDFLLPRLPHLLLQSQSA